MDRRPPDCSDADILAFARRWTDRLIAEDYAGVFGMLLHRPTHPGKSWVADAAELRAWVVIYGADEAISGEPECRVTPVATTAGDTPRVYIDRETARYPGCRGRLDWPLPLNGEWSDMQASFDLVEADGGLAFVLVALRVP